LADGQEKWNKSEFAKMCLAALPMQNRLQENGHVLLAILFCFQLFRRILSDLSLRSNRNLGFSDLCNYS
jgi:hypothetical protein